MMGILSCVTLTGIALRAIRLWEKDKNENVPRETDLASAGF